MQEQITSVQEFLAGQVLWTSYRYDPLKQIVEVSDDRGHLTHATYDNLGRRIALDNPDTGKTESQFDLAGNLVAKVTANLRAQGKAIQYSYDFLRLAKVSYPNFPGNDISYQYGAPKAPFNRAGRIVQVTRLEYDKFEQRQYLSFGNGATTQYAYDARNRRLSNLQAVTQGRTIQNLAYKYDNVGNILGLANNMAVPPPNLMGGPTTQSFAYDDLYRLTQAAGSWDYAPNKREALGFTAEGECTWTRRRTAWATDHIFAPALTKSAPELIGVNVHTGIRCELVNRLLSELCVGTYDLQRPLLSPLLGEACLPEKVPSRWNFWNNAFEEEELDDMLWHLERYALPFMESFSTLDDIQIAIQRRSELFSGWPEKVAAAFILSGRHSDARAVLERASSENLSSEQLRVAAAIRSALDDGSLERTVSKVRSPVG